MLVKILGAVDVIASAIFLFVILGFSFPTSILLIFGIILLAKSSLGMLMDFASWIDFLGGIFLLLLIVINIPTFILIAKSSLGMLMDFASWIDFLGGVFLLLLILFNIPTFMLVAMGILIIQKAFFSFLGE